MNKSAAKTKLNNGSDSNVCAQSQATSSKGDNTQQLGQAIQVPTVPEPRHQASPSSKENTGSGVSSASAEDNITDLRSQDPLLYFSDQRRRMAYLTHQEENVDQVDNPPQQQQQVVERRTRISFEVHPSLLLDDLFDNILEAEEIE